jgi:hypothetical protein
MQFWHADVAASKYVPTVQPRHVDAPTDVVVVPGPHCAQLLLPLTLVKKLTAHGEHTVAP